MLGINGLRLINYPYDIWRAYVPLKVSAVPLIYILAAFLKQYLSTELQNTKNGLSNYFLNSPNDRIQLVPF